MNFYKAALLPDELELLEYMRIDWLRVSRQPRWDDRMPKMPPGELTHTGILKMYLHSVEARVGSIVAR